MVIQRKFFLALGVLAGLGMWGQGARANLLSNGDFENEPNWGAGVSGDGGFTAFVGNQIPGWTIETDHAVTVHIHPGPYLTINGAYSVNTDGEGFDGHNADFYQDFTSVNGAGYALSFNWQSWGVGTPTLDPTEVSIVDTVTNAVLFDGFYTYEAGSHPVYNVTANFTGTGDALRIRVQETPESGYNDNSIIVDDFSVEAPEPASVGVLGLGVLGMMGRRRKMG